MADQVDWAQIIAEPAAGGEATMGWCRSVTAQLANIDDTALAPVFALPENDGRDRVLTQVVELVVPR